MRLFTLAFCSSLALTGCSTSHVTLDEKGRTIIHHWGYTRIVKPPLSQNDAQMNVTGYEVVGFSVGEGFTVGYENNHVIQVPTDCRVLVIVRDQAQFEHLLGQLDLIGAKDLCATVSPE